MKNTWVVVAESARARVFTTPAWHKPLEETSAFAHSASRQKEAELVSDVGGRSFDSGGQGRHTMTGETNHKRHEAVVFAKEIARVIDEGRINNEFEQLILVAPPEFLGHLRSELGPETENMVIAEVNKNLVVRKVDEIREHLPERF